jgi:hypothetical protein
MKKTKLMLGDNIDRNLFLRIKGLINSGIGKYDHIKDVILMLREYVKVGEVEKKKFGEVMTPLELVKEMLATLPDEVWSNPNLKWLDPANGSGPYPLMVIYRLMNGLKDWEPDEEKRYKHIVEKMIYVCELQPKNMFLYMCAVDPWDIYQLNIYTGSFLESGFDKHMKEVWGIDRVDIVIGNPPYQRNLHLDFINSSFNICNLFVLMVHPNSWLIDEKNHTKIYLKTKELIKNNLEKCIFINANKEFGIKLSSPCTITLINCKRKLEKIIVEDRISQTTSTYNKIDDINKWNNTKEYSSVKLKVDNYINKNNNLISIFGDKNLKFYINIARVRGNIDNTNDSLYSSDFFTILPKDEKVSPNFTKAFCINIENEIYAENCIKYLKTDIVRFCYSINKNDLSNNKIDMLRIPLVDFSTDWTDDKLVKEFGLTENEYQFIKNIIPNYYL